MAMSADEAVGALLRDLRREGFVLERRPKGDEYDVSAPDDPFAFRPVLVLPGTLVLKYLEQIDAEDPAMPLDPLSLTTVHLAEELGTAHHEHRNYVVALGFRRGRRGGVELFVDKDVPPPSYRAR